MKYLFLILIVLSSCTIEKRLYRPGYYVSSNSRIISNKGNQSPKVVQKSVNQLNPKSIEKIEQKTENIQLAEQKAHSKNIKKETHLVEKKQGVYTLSKDKKKVPADYLTGKTLPKINSLKTETEEQKVNDPLSNWALFFGVLSLLIVGCIPALIIGALAKKKHKKNPNKYKNEWMASVGFGMGLYVTILLGFVFLISSIFDSSAILLLGLLVCLVAIVVALIIVL